MKFFGFITLAIWAGAIAGQAQAPAAPARVQVAGTITAIDAARKQISVNRDKGGPITVVIGDHSFLRRLPPGETDTKKAVPVELSAISAGDRMLAIGQLSADLKTVEARTIYIMTKSDVAQVHAKEQEDWQKRGVAGNVASIDLAAKNFTVKAGQKVTTVEVTDKTQLMRYALDSAQLADAKPGTLAEMKIGDEVHVLGDHGADGGTVTAEKCVSGSFKQIAATISSVDPATGDLQVKNLLTKKTLTIHVNANASMRKLPPEMAARLARRYAAGARGGGAPAGAGEGGGRGDFARGRGGPGGPGGIRGGGDIKQMLDHLPAVPLTELKAGDAVMVSTTEGTDPTHLTAIMLLAGVEPLLTASPNSTRDIMSGWNLGGGAGGGEGN